MKKFILGLSAAIVLSSCVVSEPYETQTLNKTNISKFCEYSFKDMVQESIRSFHELYYISRFVEASPQEKISSKYDAIRTTLRESDTYNSFSYNSKTIKFSGKTPFSVGSTWTYNHNYHRTEKFTMLSENSWKIKSWHDKEIVVTLLSADDEGMKLDVEFYGTWVEESSYSAELQSESIDVEITNKNPIALGTSKYEGVVHFDFFEKNRCILQCDMTLRPGAPSIYDIHQ
jgi:hypothetical protein